MANGGSTAHDEHTMSSNSNAATESMAAAAADSHVPNGDAVDNGDDSSMPPTPESELPPADAKEATSEQGKIRTLLAVLRKFVGVKDLSAQRFSLPANLLHPQANLDYWCYFDRPDMFAVIPEMEDPLDRMLAVVRYSFSKELKHREGKIVKPFNSVLGEHFRCHWQLALPLYDASQGGLVPIEGLDVDKPKALPLPSLRQHGHGPHGNSSAEHSPVPTPKRLSRLLSTKKTTTSAPSTASNPGSGRTSLTMSANGDVSPPTASCSAPAFVSHLTQRSERKIVQLVEQVSHHPPVSCYYVVTDGVEAYGVDQLSARFTGSSIKIGPGQYAKGIFIKLREGAKGGAEGEEYQATHATANLNGLLRGSLWLSVADHSYITCRGGSRDGPRLRAIIEYKDESWLGKAKFALEGIIYEYDPATEGEDVVERHKKMADVEASKIRVRIAGSWKGLITYQLVSPDDPDRAGPAQPLIDLSDLKPLPKQVRPLEEHEPLESRRVWAKVIEAIHAKDYSRATKEKQIVEQRQRDEAAERKKNGTEYVTQFFEKYYSDGRPTLKPKGREVVEGMLKATASSSSATATASS